MKAVGEKVHSAVVTEEQVRQIRAMYRPGTRGFGHKEIAKKFGLSPSATWAIIKHWTWRQV